MDTLSDLHPDFPNAYYYGHRDDEITVKDFESFINHRFNAGKSFELIGGRLVLMAGNASPNHQTIMVDMSIEMGNYLKGKKCRMFYDLNLYLFNDSIGKCRNIYQPDIMVCCDENKITKRGYEGVPDLIVEIISRSTSGYDYNEKYDNYIKYGVLEYWIVDPLKNKIFVYVNKDDLTINEYTFYDTAESGIFPGLSINFEKISENLDKSELKWLK